MFVCMHVFVCMHAILNRIVRKDITEEVTIERRLD